MAHVLVIGGGGREHALAWKLAQSPVVARVSVAPGNGGTEGGKIARCDVDVRHFDTLIGWCKAEDVALVVVGPEAPLADGISDALTAAGVACFGPKKACARIEASKSFAKRFMVEHGIPTAACETVTTAEQGHAWLDAHPGPIVVKASGLAAGKGVIVCDDASQAQAAVDVLMVDRMFGDAADEVLLEERLEGPEVSVLALCDGKTAVAMPAAQDHKRAYDGDEGPNTGGMGAYAPAPVVSAELLKSIEATVLQPVVDGFASRGTPYVGVLFAGLMLTADGVRVLEFNCRFGDPETQVVLPLLQTDLFTVLQACVRGSLAEMTVAWSDRSAATVVAASGGYPAKYEKGKTIVGTDAAGELTDTTVFHAGTRREADVLVTSGGRVLAVTGVGSDVGEAIERAYSGIGEIHFEGIHHRTDIGWRALRDDV